MSQLKGSDGRAIDDGRQAVQHIGPGATLKCLCGLPRLPEGDGDGIGSAGNEEKHLVLEPRLGVNSNWIVGVFADGQFGDIRGSLANQDMPNTEGTEKLRTSYAAGVRLGYLVASPQVGLGGAPGAATQREPNGRGRSTKRRSQHRPASELAREEAHV